MISRMMWLPWLPSVSVIALAVVFGDHAAGIHVVGHQPLVDDGQFDRARGLRECRFGRGSVAQLGFEGEIARPVGPHLRRAGRERRHGADHMRQRLPVDRDRFGGVLCRRQAIGDDKGDGVADMAHHVFGQDRIDRNFDVHVRQDARRRQRPEVGHLGAGEHQTHARHGAHAIEIFDAEAGMRVRRAQHHRMQRRGRRDVGHVAAGAAQQRVVFLARERLAEAEFHRHGFTDLQIAAGAAQSAARASA